MAVWLYTGSQSAFIRQWSLGDTSCERHPRTDIDACKNAPLFDVQPLGPYTNDCHIALEVCLSLSLYFSLRLSLCLFLLYSLLVSESDG